MTLRSNSSRRGSSVAPATTSSHSTKGPTIWSSNSRDPPLLITALVPAAPTTKMATTTATIGWRARAAATSRGLVRTWTSSPHSTR